MECVLERSGRWFVPHPKQMLAQCSYHSASGESYSYAVVARLRSPLYQIVWSLRCQEQSCIERINAS